MHLPFHFTDSSFYNQFTLMYLIAVVLAFGGVLLLSFVLNKHTRSSTTSRIVRSLIGVVLIAGGVGLAVFSLTSNTQLNTKLNAEGDRVNAYNLQLLKREVANRYDVQLNTKQAQALLDNYVYNQPRSALSDPVKPTRIDVAGARTDVKLKHEGKRWYLYATSQELLPVR
jgi:predicted PurR-regulated permease PerM